MKKLKVLSLYKHAKTFIFKHKLKLALLCLIGIILVVGAGLWYLKVTYYFERKAVEKIKTEPRPTISKFDYTIVLVGDSMTEYLGNLEELGYFLNQDYPNKHFLLLNYGYGSTNILSLPNRLENDTPHDGRTFQAIDKIPFNLVLIESFGNNPLSQYPLAEGLKKQDQTLDQAVSLITKTHPKSSIVFVATIAPNREHYGEGSVNLSESEREKWADERSAYIKNHIAYAKSHNIPVIDIYDQSLNWFGDGNLAYIRPQDHIHPSTTGIYYIDQNIAQFIYKNKLLPTR